MYRRVPPPEQAVLPSSENVGGEEGSRDLEDEGKEPPRPSSISEEQWKKFQELKVRREKECGKHANQRKSAVRNQALKAVSRDFTLVDKSILEEEGTSLPEQGRGRRKRKKRKLESHVDSKRGGESESQVRVEMEEEWQAVKKYLDPNPRLRGVAKSGLEEKMDSAIERGEFEEAATMSDRLVQREFATQVTTAFDCHKFVKRRKVEEERKRTKKPRPQWSFEHKQRWETKGNM